MLLFFIGTTVGLFVNLILPRRLKRLKDGETEIVFDDPSIMMEIQWILAILRNFLRKKLGDFDS